MVDYVKSAATDQECGGIYHIRNINNGKRYIGSAVKFRTRFIKHRSLLNNGKHHSSHLQLAWNKYGESSFVFEAIEIVLDKSNLIEREQFWIDFLHASDRVYGYNARPIAGSQLGMKHTELSKYKNAIAHIGKKHSQEHKDKIGASSRGRKMSEDAKRKMSEAASNRKHTPESIAKIIAARKNQVSLPHSEETKLKISAANKGKKKPPVSLETRMKISALHKGKKRSAEAIKNIRDGRWGASNGLL